MDNPAEDNKTAAAPAHPKKLDSPDDFEHLGHDSSPLMDKHQEIDKTQKKDGLDYPLGKGKPAGDDFLPWDDQKKATQAFVDNEQFFGGLPQKAPLDFSSLDPFASGALAEKKSSAPQKDFDFDDLLKQDVAKTEKTTIGGDLDTFNLNDPLGLTKVDNVKHSFNSDGGLSTKTDPKYDFNLDLDPLSLSKTTDKPKPAEEPFKSYAQDAAKPPLGATKSKVDDIFQLAPEETSVFEEPSPVRPAPEEVLKPAKLDEAVKPIFHEAPAFQEPVKVAKVEDKPMKFEEKVEEVVKPKVEPPKPKEEPKPKTAEELKPKKIEEPKPKKAEEAKPEPKAEETRAARKPEPVEAELIFKRMGLGKCFFLF